MTRVAMIYAATALMLALLVVGNAVAQSRHINGLAIAAADAAVACAAWFLMVRLTSRRRK
jgi:hypothetical protein